MKIAELCRISGVHRSTVHHYLNLGLLPAPRTLGPKLRHFGVEHVERLREIQRLRAEGVGLAEIRGRLAPVRVRVAAPRRAPSVGEAVGEVRARILDAAALLFRERGYDGVGVVAIARAAGVAKGTLYRHFVGKRELFVECLDRLRFSLATPEQRAHAARLAFPAEAELRARAVLTRFAAYRDMSDLLAAAARGRRVDIAARAREALHRMICNAEPSLRRAVAAGQVRGRDSELLAYMSWGALLALGDRLQLDSRYGIDEAIGHYLEFIGVGG